MLKWCVLAVAFTATVALAVSFEWVGGSAGDWTDDAEWYESVEDPDGYPNLGDDATIAEDADVTITLEGDLCMDDLTVNPEDDHTITIISEAGGDTLGCDTVTIAGPTTGQSSDFTSFGTDGDVSVRTDYTCS